MDTRLNQKDGVFSDASADELGVHYRSISKAAVLSLIFAVLSLAFILASVLVLLPVMGIGFGLIGLSNIRRMPQELIGGRFAKIGLGLSTLMLIGGASFHIYDYVTEVPEGYQRISWRSLRDDTKSPLPYSEKAEELDGQKVFLRGYVRPGSKRTNLDEFIMVGNFGACCFGGIEKITDVVAVSIKSDQRVNYSLRVRKVIGTFKLNRRATRTTEKEVPEVFYQIDAEEVR